MSGFFIYVLITQISKQKKDRKRYNIYLDNEFYCGLYDDTIIKFGLCRGDEISEKKINEIVNFDEYIYGKKIAFDYLSYRIRTVSEIKKKLRSKKISDESIGKVLKHLAELGLTNDEEFAAQLVKEKIKNKPVGRKVLKQKLFEKGISKEVSENVLEKTFSEVDEKELAMRNFRKYKPKLEGIEINSQKKKTFDYLARKGFDFDVIKEIINENIR
jgi:regulatory protein